MVGRPAGQARAMNRADGLCEDELRIDVKTAATMTESPTTVAGGLTSAATAMALLVAIFTITKIVAA